MKTIILTIIVLLFIGCISSESQNYNLMTQGTFELHFDHYVGDSELKLEETNSKVLNYRNNIGQKYSLTKFGYYITNVKLIQRDQQTWSDEIQSSIHKEDVKGFYQINESKQETKELKFHGLTDGHYTQIQFDVGIAEEFVEQGAQGGILDLASGAWFWNWNSGYIGMKIEGYSDASIQEADADLIEGGITYHVGGWRNIEPVEGETPMIVNNVITIELDLTQNIIVNQGSTPIVHVVVDVAKILDGASIDFSQENHIHMPGPGASLAKQFNKAFIVHHVH